MRGSSPMSTQSAFTSSKPAAWTRAYASASSTSESAPRYDVVVRRKERADVAEAGGAEQRVGERMGDDVTVGVADEPARMVDRDAAEHERDAVAERMRIDANADAVAQTSAVA